VCRLLILVVYSFVGSLGVVCSTPLLPSSYHWFVQCDLFICCWLFSLLLVAVIVVTCLSFVVVSYFCLLLSLLLLSLLLLLLLLSLVCRSLLFHIFVCCCCRCYCCPCCCCCCYCWLIVVIVVDCCYSIGFSTTHHLKPRNTVGQLPCVLVIIAALALIASIQEQRLYREDLLSQP
jgi:hypothetical protein